MSSEILFGLAAIAYIILLFVIAWRGESASRRGKSWINNPWVYTLSLGVYCSAWTYFGSTGRAVSHGFDFLTIYLGPTLMAPLWLFVQKKAIRISRNQNSANLADFLDTRYGKTLRVGLLVTIISLLGTIPYISLQLKAIGLCFSVASKSSASSFFADPVFLIMFLLGFFAILFGSKKLEIQNRHEGLVAAIAFESIVKLVAFIALGIFVCFVLFNGPSDLFNKPAYQNQVDQFFGGMKSQPLSSWAWMILLSMLAVNLLPRMFQAGVVENKEEKHVDHASWGFPLYLFLINLFVIPVAIAGSTLFGNAMDPDTFVFDLPLLEGYNWLAMVVFLGGFSAATGMIIVEAIALGGMLTNNAIMPFVVGLNFKDRDKKNGDLSHKLGLIRAAAIIAVLIISYVYYRYIGQYLPLVSIGLTAFVAISQIAPAYFGALYWKHANLKGATYGMIVGFTFWVITLILPSLSASGLISEDILSNGFFGLEMLRPQALFGLEGLDPIVHGMIWSLGLNTLIFLVVSLNTLPTPVERNFAEIYTQIEAFENTDQAIVWRGTARNADLIALLSRFLNAESVQNLIRTYEHNSGEQINPQSEAKPRFVNFCERTLSGMVGSGSTRVLFSKVLQEEKIRLNHVVEMLAESQKILLSNKELRRQKIELKKAGEALRKSNEQLKVLDSVKDEFLSTVTHELRTPITSIRALVEIVYDNPELEEQERQHFLGTVIKETERLTRLISQVLDLEKYDSGKQKLYFSKFKVGDLLNDALLPLKEAAKEQKIHFEIMPLQLDLELSADKDKLIQVLQNLGSNSLKFCKSGEGKIQVIANQEEGDMIFQVIDNGSGIPSELHEAVFQKFYQAPDQNTRKPKGSGLGLAICHKIIDLHGGRIHLESQPGMGTKVSFTIPVYPTESI